MVDTNFSRGFSLLLLAFCGGLVACYVQPVAAQGLLVDVRPDRKTRLPRPRVRPNPTPTSGSYKIESIEVNATLRDQIAQVQVAQTFVNTSRRQMEVAFLFPLPYDGAIDQLTLLIDGKEYDAALLPADQARQTYETIVRKNRDPALLEWVGSGLFRTSVFPVPAGAKRTVTLRYTQLCRHTHGLTDFLFPLRAAKYTSAPLEQLKIRVVIESQSPITNIYSATHAVKLDRPDQYHAIVTHESTNTLPVEDFRLFYDSTVTGISASLLSYRPTGDQDGYFLLLASPKIKSEPVVKTAKTVVFVVDRSGSMSGEKITQAKEALKFVLNNLRQGDLFNIVTYDSKVESFRPELQQFDSQSRQAALGFVEGIYTGGSTNINAALVRGMNMLQDSSQPAYVIFLTDGLPTTGETGEAAIVANCQKTNRVRARLFPFGVGYNVNSRLLDRLAGANFGQSEYVRPTEDIEVAVSTLVTRIKAPVMTNVTAGFDLEMNPSPGVSATNRVYPKGSFDLFAGDQVVLVGRYRGHGTAKVTLQGAVGGNAKSFEFPAKFAKQSDDDTNAFVAKLWATRRVGEIIDELDLNGHQEELTTELVTLATEHGILTPYTSFLADETSNIRNIAENRDRSSVAARDLRQASGREGMLQRFAKGQLKNAKRAPASAYGGGFGSGFGMAGGSASGGANYGRPHNSVPMLGKAQGEKLVDNLGRGVMFFDHRQDKQIACTTICALGRKTFFLREGRWIDSSVTEKEEDNAEKIERFSQEYFDLISRHGKQVAKYFVLDEPVVCKLGGQTYRW